MPELWRPVRVDGEEWPYEVSNLGRVRRSEPGPSTRVGYVLKLSPINSGYHMVHLSADGHRLHVLVHHLVLEAFVDPRPGGHEANHINGDKTDNRPENLEWVTPAQNSQHAHANGLKPPGEAHPNAKLTEPEVREIRQRYAAGGVTQRALARQYGVARSRIGSIVRYETWAHVTAEEAA